MDFTHIYDLVEELYYEDNGRPSIDPLVSFKLVLIQHLFGIRSLRQMMRDEEGNVAYRWFLGYTLFRLFPHFATINSRLTEVLDAVTAWGKRNLANILLL